MTTFTGRDIPSIYLEQPMRFISISLKPILIMALALLAACSSQPQKQEQPADDRTTKPVEAEVPSASLITFTSEGLYPEGIAYDPSRRGFIVTSMTKGQLGLVDASGNYTLLIQDTALVSAVGVKVDARRNRIIVCNSDPGVSEKTSPATQGKLGQVLIYNLSSLKRVRLIELGKMLPEGGHFANDLTMDNSGNLYVTDSFSPVIYKIDLAGNASLFFEAPDLAGTGFGFNGIELHPDGYLLVAKYNDGTLYKVPLADANSYSHVILPQAYHGADGLLLKEATQLILIANASTEATNQSVLLQSTDGWATATELQHQDTGVVFPTTATLVEDRVYVLYSNLNALFGGEPLVSDYEIHQLAF